MRAKIVVPALSLGLLGVALILFHPGTPRPAPAQPPGEPVAEVIPTAEAPARQAAEPPAARPDPAAAPAARAETVQEKQAAYVEARVAELQDLGLKDDTASLDAILAELANRDPQIRKAALEAAVQFGSRDAIPRLMDAATQTDDPREKAAIADAVEFLKLPSLTEVLDQVKSGKIHLKSRIDPPRQAATKGFETSKH